MSSEAIRQTIPFHRRNGTSPKFKPDAYGIHAKNLTQEHLAVKLNLPGRVVLPPALPMNLPGRVVPPYVLPMHFARSKSVEAAGTKKVGILGAGVGGLYAAMMLHSLDIPFEILEASDRTGGRVFTYRFSTKPHDYYDVGAMRFPDEPAMQRLFHLFKSDELNQDDRHVKEKLIDYKFSSPHSFRFFNGHRLRARNIITQEDQFDFAATGVPKLDLTNGYEATLKATFGSFVEGLKKDLEPPGSTNGWQMMMRQDNHSARSYMALACNYPMPTVHWCETLDASTDAYDKAFSETVLDMVAFGDEKTEWKCLDGGSEVLTSAMTDYLETYAPGSLFKNKTVTGLRTSGSKEVIGIDVQLGQETRKYEHVISTIPLPVFRTLDLDDPRLFDVQQTNALRELSYGPAIKIGIKFTSPWWTEKLNIVGGQSYTDRNIRTTVYPSYGIGSTDKTSVLIASYMWTADATSMGALIKNWEKNTELTERLKEIVLRDLAQVHDIEVKVLKDKFVEMFPWAWQNDPLTQGAFAFFGPGQFEKLYKGLARPCAGEYLHMAGEALSPRHAWIVGALDSSWRAVEEILVKSYSDTDKLSQFKELWGENEEWIVDPEWSKQMQLSDKTSTGLSVDLVMLNMAAHSSEWVKSLE